MNNAGLALQAGWSPWTPLPSLPPQHVESSPCGSSSEQSRTAPHIEAALPVCGQHVVLVHMSIAYSQSAHWIWHAGPPPCMTDLVPALASPGIAYGACFMINALTTLHQLEWVLCAAMWAAYAAHADWLAWVLNGAVPVQPEDAPHILDTACSSRSQTGSARVSMGVRMTWLHDLDPVHGPYLWYPYPMLYRRPNKMITVVWDIKSRNLRTALIHY